MIFFDKWLRCHFVLKVSEFEEKKNGQETSPKT